MSWSCVVLFVLRRILSSHMVFFKVPGFGLPLSFSNATNVYVMHVDIYADYLSNVNWMVCHELCMPILMWMKLMHKLTHAFLNYLIKGVGFPHFCPLLEKIGSGFLVFLVVEFFFGCLPPAFQGQKQFFYFSLFRVFTLNFFFFSFFFLLNG